MDPFNLSHADFRSPSLTTLRTRTDLEKYYSYKVLKRGQLSIPHYISICTFHKRESCPKCYCGDFAHDKSKRPVRKITRKEFYEEAQRWPKPPVYHSSGWKREDRWGCATGKWAKRYEEGRERMKEMKYVDFDDMHLADFDAEDDWLGVCCEEEDWENMSWRITSWDWRQYVWDDDGDDEGYGEMESEGQAVEMDRISMGTMPTIRTEAGDIETADWDVVSCISEMTWSEVDSDDEWLEA